jgi:iron(III) transport system permease protein
VGAVVLVLVMGLPLIWLAFAALAGVANGSNGPVASMLPVGIKETGVLMLSVGVMTGVLGLLAAWLVTHFEFPLRRVFDWALILPLAVPTYLAAYTYVEFLDFSGPIQQAIRALTGAKTIRDYWFPEIRSNAGAAMVMSLVLYPYVYASCRAFFLMASGSMSSAARVLGANGYRTFFAVVLPLSRPALVVGMTLAMLEVVNDLGAVQYFGVNSLTAVIYATWINRSNFGGAAQLAVMMVLIIGLLILAEQRARHDRVTLASRDSRTPPPRERLSGIKAVFAVGFCALLLAAGFGVPFFEMLSLALKKITPDALAATGSALLTTITLAGAGALITVMIGLYAAKRGSRDAGRIARSTIRLATLGYAMPGTVLALGLLQPLGLGDRWLNNATQALFGWGPGLVLSGSTVALLYVYAIRFLAVSHSTLDAAMKKRGRSVLDAAQVLGARKWELLFRIDLPTLTPAIASAATLVFVEIIKELPATLLLRPLGVETLSTMVYARANAALFAEASLPALAIVLAGLIPVILATQLGARRKV